MAGSAGSLLSTTDLVEYKDYWETFNTLLKQVVPIVDELAGSSDVPEAKAKPILEALEQLLTRAKDQREKGKGQVKNPLLRWKLVQNLDNLKNKMRTIVERADHAVTEWNDQVMARAKVVLVELSNELSEVMEQGAPLLLPMPSQFVVGIERHVGALKELLLRNSEVRDTYSGRVGVVGMGGAGKTLLVNTICRDDDILDRFRGISCVTVTRTPDIARCQAQVHRDLLGDANLQQFIAEEDDVKRKEWLRFELQHQRVMLVLDEVWCRKISDLDNLMVINPANGSRVLFTTRGSHLFRQTGSAYKFELKEMKQEYAMQLFCYNAFGSTKAPGHMQGLVKQVVDECGGLPLALEVTGAAVASYAVDNTDEDGCRGALEFALERLAESEVLSLDQEELLLQRLRLSYDALSAKEKQCFLHFASVADDYRMLLSDVIDLWSTAQGIKSNDALMIWGQLVAMSLIKWDRQGAPGFQLTDEELAMRFSGFADIFSTTCYVHRVIRDMAMFIINGDDVVKRERWYSPGPEPSHEEVFYHWPADIPGRELSLSNKKITSWPQAVRMPNMRVLQLRDTGLVFVPSGVCLLTQLRVLDLSFTNITQLPEGITNLKSLKLFQLDACKYLNALPDQIGVMAELTVLSLRFCGRLRHLPESVGWLGNLHSLHAPGCAFKSLPATIGRLRKLRRLDLSSCERIAELPANFSSLTSLELLNLYGLWELQELPDSFGSLSRLRKLFIGGCLKLKSLPDSLTALTQLELLDMQYCCAIEVLPMDIGSLCSLRTLYLDYCSGLKTFPASMDRMTSLETLGLDFRSVKHKHSTQHLEGPGIDCYLNRGRLPGGVVERIRQGTIRMEDQLREQSIVHCWKTNGWTSLHASVFQGTDVLSKQIANLKELINTGDWKGSTPLHWAAWSNKLESVELLLEAGAVPDTQEKNGCTPLHRAAAKGCTSCAAQLLEAGAQIDVQEEIGFTALHCAAENGRKEVVDLLVTHGAVLDLVTKKGATSLHLAAKNGHTKVVDLLLRNGAAVDIVTQDGWTPLMYAAQKGHLHVVGTFLERGAEVNQQNEHGSTALTLAAEFASYEMAELLIQRCARVDIATKNGWTPLTFAARRGAGDIVELLFKNGANVNHQNKNGWTPLTFAARRGHIDVVELLFRNGVNVNHQNKHGWTALHKAACHGDSECVKVLLDGGATIDIKNDRGWTALHKSTFDGDIDCARALLAGGASIDIQEQDGVTGLHVASQNGHREVVNLLLKNEADVNLVTQEGATSLHYAAQNGHKEVVDVLVQHGAKVDIVDQYGFTSLLLASWKGHLPVVEVLVENGAMLELPGQMAGLTPLSLAADRGHIGVVELLIEKGASLDVPEEDGGTALHSAARMGHLDIVEELVDHGASIDLPNQAGNTAMMIAASRGHMKVVRWLIAKGANMRHKNKDGNSALNAAAEFGHHATVDLLTEMGAADLSTEGLAASGSPDFGIAGSANLLSVIGANKDGSLISDFVDRDVGGVMDDVGSPGAKVDRALEPLGKIAHAGGMRGDEGPSSMDGGDDGGGVQFIPQPGGTISNTDLVVNLPGGGWDGFWKQPMEGGQVRAIDTWVRIHFRDGAIVGVGDDEVGDYVIEGHYDTEEQTCVWSKKYVDPQAVRVHEGRFVMITRGFLKGHVSMEGTWRTGDDVVGVFLLVSRQRHD
eukprot:evm.model.scf_898EXC.1 EVM.evm.TU.scf_898EXC.1   scf_898EXC:999-25322(+)